VNCKLQPELRGLVLDNKQHLVMGGGKRQLRLQYLVELEIAGIGYFFELTHRVHVLRQVDDIFGRAIPAQPLLCKSVADDILSLKGWIFAVNRDFCRDSERQPIAHGRNQVVAVVSGTGLCLVYSRASGF
jgi:hypothetical protein